MAAPSITPDMVDERGKVLVYCFTSKAWIKRRTVDAKELVAMGHGSLEGPTDEAPASPAPGVPGTGDIDDMDD